MFIIMLSNALFICYFLFYVATKNIDIHVIIKQLKKIRDCRLYPIAYIRVVIIYLLYKLVFQKLPVTKPL